MKGKERTEGKGQNFKSLKETVLFLYVHSCTMYFVWEYELWNAVALRPGNEKTERRQQMMYQKRASGCEKSAQRKGYCLSKLCSS